MEGSKLIEESAWSFLFRQLYRDLHKKGTFVFSKTSFSKLPISLSNNLAFGFGGAVARWYRERPLSGVLKRLSSKVSCNHLGVSFGGLNALVRQIALGHMPRDIFQSGRNLYCVSFDIRDTVQMSETLRRLIPLILC
jgi:hypothetical protein